MKIREVINEGWSQKYKKSINCSHPKGFSQKAHCAGKKKHNESVEMEMVCEDCGMCETHGDHLHNNLDEACWKGYHKDGMKTMFGKRYPNCVKNKKESLETYIRKGECPGCGEQMVAESQLNEKQDACYHKVKSRYKVWPSAYASGALVQCRKKGAANWGNSNESITQEEYDALDENLKKWFSDKWVRFGPDGKIKGDCARGDSSEGKPKCLPQSKAHSLGKKGRASAASRKRREDPNPERSGPAINVKTKEEGVAEAPDSDFIGFMNKTMGTRQDKAVTKYNPKITMSMKNMPGYRKAFKFGMDVIKKMDPDTKKQFAEERDDAFVIYMMNIAEKKGYVPEHFVYEDLDEVTGEFEEIFSDPDMEGWSWSDLLRDMIGMPVRADAKANVQAHKAQMAKSQQKAAAGADPIDPKKLKVVNPTGSSTYEIWYPSGDFYGTSTWEVIEKGFKDEDAANNRIAQLQKDPDVVKKIKAAIDQKDVSEGIDELARVLELSGLNITADEQFDIIEEMVESLALEHGVDAETIWEEFESVDDHELFEAAAWQKKSGKSKTGGLNAKGVASYRRENPGSKLQMAVTTKPSKLKPGSKAAKRRKSFCARMGGNKGPMKKPNGKPTRKALALRKWNC